MSMHSVSRFRRGVVAATAVAAAVATALAGAAPAAADPGTSVPGGAPADAPRSTVTAAAPDVAAGASAVVTVTVSGGGDVAGGSVQVTSGGRDLAAGTLGADGTARVALPAAPAGTRVVRVAFAGTGHAAGAVSDPLPVVTYLPDAGPGGGFYQDITWALDRGVVQGYVGGIFAPAAAVSRQSMAALLYRYTHPGAARPQCTGTERAFTDVAAGHVFCGEIEWLAHSGITRGAGGGVFAPERSVSRQSMAALLYRLQHPGAADPVCSGADRSFADVAAGDEFCGVIEGLAGDDVIRGYADGTFRPRLAVSRQAAAALVHRVSQAEEADACLAAADDGSGVIVGSDQPGDPSLPEPASGYRMGLSAVYGTSYLVSTSNALASAAGCAVLQRGGTAADAAVAVQAMLGLTVPEATGLGSGGFMLYYEAATGTVQAYDGRETAPQAATENYLRYVDDADDHAAPTPSARASGRSIGTPGIPRLLEAVQRDHGALPWASLFDAAITRSTDGFRIGGRLAASINSNARNLSRDADAAAYFLHADGSPKQLGELLANPQYADALTQIAGGGADAFYSGAIAADVVAKIGSALAADGTPITPGKTTAADLAGYRVVVRDAVCTTYRDRYEICGMPPPSSGGIAVASALGILENFDLKSMAPSGIDGEGGEPDVRAVHLITEAERLAYADRDKYVADTDFVPLPGGSWDSLLDKAYLAQRASTIDPGRSMGTARAGDFDWDPRGIDTTDEHGTNQFTIIDALGNVVSATTTVEGGMGSFHMTHGFLLNNQLTDFSAAPVDADGIPIANRVGPGKRPRSSMAPTVVFDRTGQADRGQLVMATGSPGGGTIPQYVIKTLVGALDWGLDAQQSANLIDFGASNNPRTTIGGEHPNVDTTDGGAHDPLISGLIGLGHQISTGGQSSGVNTIMRVDTGSRIVVAGGTDPRREGLVLGSTARR